MPCLSGQFDPKISPLLQVGVSAPGARETPGSSIPEGTSYVALLDTGASHTCITPVVAQTAQLRAIGKRAVISATGARAMNVFLADLLLPFGATGLTIDGTMVVEFAQPPHANYQVVLGRDILCRGQFSLGFDGHFSFAL